MYTMWALSTVYNAYSPTPWMKKTLTALEDFWCFPIVTQIYWCLFIVSNTECNQRAGQKYQENASKSKAIILS